MDIILASDLFQVLDRRYGLLRIARAHVNLGIMLKESLTLTPMTEERYFTDFPTDSSHADDLG